MTYLYAIFGAPDPEREAALELAQQAGLPAALATAGGQPVSPESAYRADGFQPLSRDLESAEVVLLFECDGPALRARLGDARKVEVLDHRRRGDRGYGRPPQDFLAASSLGQLISRVAEMRLLPRAWKRVPLPDAFDYVASGPGSISYAYYSPRRGVVGPWLICDSRRDTATMWPVVPQELVFAAAADHCLAAAYRGECPGVVPDTLMRWRVESRAAFQRRDPAQLLADVERARAALRSAPQIDLGGELVADLRGPTIPELPEAAAREGIAFIATPPVRAGERQKVVLQCAGPVALAAWPVWAQAQGLVDLYGGDPARGFAGGYLRA